jgi:hypothetical protein
MPEHDDELRVQLPGRLITIEILLVLALREKPDVARIMREADAMLTSIEDRLYESETPSAYALEVLSEARAALDKITAEATR